MEPLGKTAETVAVDGSFNIHETAIPNHLFEIFYILVLIPKPVSTFGRHALKIEPAAQNVNRHFMQPALNFFDA